MFRNHCLEPVDDLMKAKQRDENCIQQLKILLPSALGRRFVAGEYAPYVKDYMRKGNIILNSSERLTKFQRLLAGEKFRTSQIIRNTFFDHCRR